MEMYYWIRRLRDQIPAPPEESHLKRSITSRTRQSTKNQEPNAEMKRSTGIRSRQEPDRELRSRNQNICRQRRRRIGSRFSVCFLAWSNSGGSLQLCFWFLVLGSPSGSWHDLVQVDLFELRSRKSLISACCWWGDLKQSLWAVTDKLFVMSGVSATET